jgi:hypothetical protein
MPLETRTSSRGALQSNAAVIRNNVARSITTCNISREISLALVSL